MTGLIAQHPGLGGVAWDYVQYPLGLKRLGYDVYYVEDSGQWPYNPAGGATGSDWMASDCRPNVRHLANVMERFGLQEKWAYRCPLGGDWFGLSDVRRKEVLTTADLLVNVSGSLEHPYRYDQVGRLAYIDSDPVFTQVRLAAGPTALGLSDDEVKEERKFRRRVDAHHVHFSFGECLSDAVPRTEHDWRPTRQPIVLAEWRQEPRPGNAFSTVMSWTSYRPLHADGKMYGQKDLEFKRFLELPRRVPEIDLMVALNLTRHRDWESRADDGSYERLTRAGWLTVDATTVCGDVDRYRAFIRGSRGEWSVAKHGYVVGRPGWFSCRSACYLAAGRPVIVQDTGFEKVIPVGQGVLAFSDLEEAVAGLEQVQADYGLHSEAAVALAEQIFDSDIVLERLVEDCMTPGVRAAAVGDAV